MKQSPGSLKRLAVRLVAAMGLLPVSSFACAACYGEPGAPMSKGLTWAVVLLGGVIAAVLAGVTVFFVHVGRRESQMEEPGQGKEPK